MAELCKACKRGAETTHRCFKCADNICDKCAEDHRVLKMFDSHRAVPFGNVTDGVEKCAKHGAVLSLFCTKKACQRFICPQCTGDGEDHSGHEHGSIPDVALRCRQEIDKKVAPIRDLKGNLSKNADHMAFCKGEVQKQNKLLSAKFQAKLQYAITSSLRPGGQRETAELSDEEAQVLDERLHDIEKDSDTVGGLLTFVDSLIGRATDRDVVKAMSKIKTIEERIAKLLRKYTPKEDESQCFHVTTLLPTTEQMTSFIVDHTKVVLIKPPDPSKCIYEGPDVADTNEESCCRVFVRDGEDQPCNAPHSARVVFRSLADDSDRNVLQQAVNTLSAGCYKILFTPVVRGSYSVEVTVNGTPIAGSPFRMLATLPLTKMGINGPVRVIPNMGGPTRLSFIRDSGNFSVSERNGRRLRLMRITGDQFAVIKYQASEFTGTAYDPAGYVYAAASSTSQLMKFSHGGELLASVGSEGPAPGQFRNPTAVCLYNGVVYVTDSNNSRMQYFDEDLKLIREFHGDKQFPFLQPRGVIFDRNGAMYVADSGNRCIQKFQDNKLMLVFGMDYMQSPAAVAISRSGNYILASDCDKNMVFVFTTKGKYVHAFGGEGNGAGQFRYPVGLAMDGDGYLWVCDYLNDRLQVF